jgi:hypothetical protein
MPLVWTRPLHISAHLQFLFDNAPPSNPAQDINLTCNGPHVENVSSGTRNYSKYDHCYVFIRQFLYIFVPALTFCKAVYSKTMYHVETLATGSFDTIWTCNASWKGMWVAVEQRSDKGTCKVTKCVGKNKNTYMVVNVVFQEDLRLQLCSHWLTHKADVNFVWVECPTVVVLRRGREPLRY